MFSALLIFWHMSRIGEWRISQSDPLALRVNLRALLYCWLERLRHVLMRDNTAPVYLAARRGDVFRPALA